MKLIVIAMQGEAEALIKNIKPNKDNLYYLNDDTAVLITGIGKVNAASRLSYIVAKYKIDLVINTGFVGATPPFMINDFVLVNKAQYHDFDLTMFGYEKGQVPKLPTRFNSDEKLFNILKKFGYKDSLLLTGDVFLQEKLDEEFLCDMEGTALYHVCRLHNIPIISIKMVSDIIGSKDHLNSFKSFEEEQAGEEIKTVINQILEVL